jgi:hypothetical protein
LSSAPARESVSSGGRTTPAKAADPSLTILLALRQVVYDLISRNHALTPNTVV